MQHMNKRGFEFHYPDNKKTTPNGVVFGLYGGEGGIRTHGTRKGTLVFKTRSFNRSDTSPAVRILHDINALHSLDCKEFAHIFVVIGNWLYNPETRLVFSACDGKLWRNFILLWSYNQ